MEDDPERQGWAGGAARDRGAGRVGGGGKGSITPGYKDFNFHVWRSQRHLTVDLLRG